MKKLLIIPTLLLCLLLCACQSSSKEDYTSQLKLNISHINESDEDKIISISYPIFGGIDDKETITIINSSISNYVTSEYDAFQDALTVKEQNILSNTEEILSSQVEAPSYQEEAEESEETTESTDEVSVEDSTKESDSSNEPITLNMSFKITYNKNNYLCIVQSYDKDLGEGKDFSGQRSFFFSLENASYLSLGEIFVFDESFTNYINSEINKQLESGAYTTYDDNSGFTGISKNSKFYIDSNKLYIYYDALEISPDKDVIPTFAFDLSDVKKYTNEDFANIF